METFNQIFDHSATRDLSERYVQNLPVLGARRDKVYVFDQPDDWFEGNGACTREQ